MAYEPISGLPPQFSALADGTSASDYYLKFYAADGTTPINMATDTTGGTLLAKCKINSTGYTVNGSNAVFIPHIDQEYKLALYPSEALADANTLASATWVVDDIPYSGGTALSTIRASGEFVKEFATMSAAIASTTLVEGDVILVKDRASSHWDVVLSSGVTENSYDIVQGVGVGTLSYQLRINESTDIKAFGVPGADADYTAGIAAAIAATVNKKLLWSAGTYQSDSIVVPSNVHWVFDKNCTLKATTGYASTEELLDFTSATDFVLECNDAVFQMIKSEYTTGEHRHCFNLVNCTDGLIINPNAIDSGGDGYYVNGATRVTIVNPKADNNRRNGMSVIKATDLNVTGIAKFTDQTGTNPQSGLVIEPNSDTDSLIRVNFDTVECTGNAADALSIYLDDYKTGTPADVSININKLISRGNTGRAVRISNVFLNSGSYGGTITIGEVVSDDDVGAAISIVDKSVSGPFLSIGKVTAWNPCTGASAFAETAAVYLGDTSATVSGGMSIGPVSARATHTDMDYGVICEMGAGFSDTRILVENVRGQQVTPVRLNNITSTIAEASDLIVQMDKLNETVALTTGTNIVATAHLGRVITNTGAVGSITLALREYPPVGNPYRFRVTEAQTIAIDTFDATDRIVGTTTAGATVTSNVIGAECEVYYLGTFGGVRYWKHDPIGPAASWTYN